MSKIIINVEKLISLIEFHGEVIWKKNHIKYQNRTAVQKAWDTIIERLELDPQCQETRKKVRDKWSALRSRYVREFQREKLETPKSGSGRTEFVTKFENYKSLKFLKDFATPRKSDSKLKAVLKKGQKRKKVQEEPEDSSDSSDEDSDIFHKESESESVYDLTSNSDLDSYSESETDSAQDDSSKLAKKMGSEEKSRKKEKKNHKEKSEGKTGKSGKRESEVKLKESRDVGSPANTPPKNGNVGVENSAPPSAPVLVPTMNLAELFNHDWDHMFFFLSLHNSMIKLRKDVNMALRSKISEIVSLFVAKDSIHTHDPFNLRSTSSRSTEESSKSTEKNHEIITVEDDEDSPPTKRWKTPQTMKIETIVVKREKDAVRMNERTEKHQQQPQVPSTPVATPAASSTVPLNQQSNLWFSNSQGQIFSSK